MPLDADGLRSWLCEGEGMGKLGLGGSEGEATGLVTVRTLTETPVFFVGGATLDGASCAGGGVLVLAL